MIKAIICDLDRTLLRTDKTISDFTLRVLKACKARGILLIAATARPERAITAYQDLVGFDASVTLNGAAMTYSDQTVRTGIKAESASDIIRELSRIRDAVISLETDQGLLANKDIPEWQPKVVHNLAEAHLPEAIYKVLVSSESADLKSVLPTILPADTYFTVANGNLFQVMNSNATKWYGIRKVLHALGLDPADAVYFGDDQDDIESILHCGTGVAMKNAIDEVIKAADFVTDSNDDDGVATYLIAELNIKIE